MENASTIEKVIVSVVVLSVCLIAIIAEIKVRKIRREWVKVSSIVVKREEKNETYYHWVKYNFNGVDYTSCVGDLVSDGKSYEVGSALTVLVNPIAPHKSHMVS